MPEEAIAQNGARVQLATDGPGGLQWSIWTTDAVASVDLARLMAAFDCSAHVLADGRVFLWPRDPAAEAPWIGDVQRVLEDAAALPLPALRVVAGVRGELVEFANVDLASA